MLFYLSALVFKNKEFKFLHLVISYQCNSVIIQYIYYHVSTFCFIKWGKHMIVNSSYCGICSLLWRADDALLYKLLTTTTMIYGSWIAQYKLLFFFDFTTTDNSIGGPHIYYYHSEVILLLYLNILLHLNIINCFVKNLYNIWHNKHLSFG
jgi:hypothetical protein